MKIQNVNDPSFRGYGTVLKEYDIGRLLKEMEHTPLPLDDVVYVASAEALEDLPVAEDFQNRGYGGLPVQVGYCNGYNKKLNALEYHRSSEINVAVTDLILLIGRQQDITCDYTYDTQRTEAFLVPAGTVVEMYATTLHYAPCAADQKGFRCVVVLPKGTNTSLPFKPREAAEESLLMAKNKWLLAHKEAGISGAYCGLEGINITI